MGKRVIGLLPSKVKEPLMPKGVEHPVRTVAVNPFDLVKEPLMPKGVEHPPKPLIPPLPPMVKEPLMPKGVEHLPQKPLRWNTTRCERTFDAERR